MSALFLIWFGKGEYSKTKEDGCFLKFSMTYSDNQRTLKYKDDSS